MGEGVFDPDQLGVEAYLYLYPLVTMEVTRRQMTNMAAGKTPGRAPMGQFAHVPAFPTADFRIVVRPNFDTLYYYVLPVYDMWTDAFAAPGWRTTGTGEQHYALVPPGWSGSLPGGVTALAAPTPTVWIIGRTQTNGPADYEAVHQVQAGYTATPLARWGRPPAPPPPFETDPAVDMTASPLDQVEAMPAAGFFTLAAELMKVHPPHPTDFSVLNRIARIGLRPGDGSTRRGWTPKPAPRSTVPPRPRRS